MCRYDACTTGSSPLGQDERWREKVEERETEIEREHVSMAQDYFLLKIIPCSPVGTHTQTTPRLSVFSPGLWTNETSLFFFWCGELASGESMPGRESVRESRGVRRERRV